MVGWDLAWADSDDVVKDDQMMASFSHPLPPLKM